MALSSSSWQVAFVISPALGGFILQAQPFALWPIAAAICLAGGAYALVLERRIPRDYRRTPTDVDEAAKLTPVEAAT
jgi:MFS family permease